jgi:hypothetical protein
VPDAPKKPPLKPPVTDAADLPVRDTDDGAKAEAPGRPSDYQETQGPEGDEG